MAIWELKHSRGENKHIHFTIYLPVTACKLTENNGTVWEYTWKIQPLAKAHLQLHLGWVKMDKTFNQGIGVLFPSHLKM